MNEYRFSSNTTIAVSVLMALVASIPLPAQGASPPVTHFAETYSIVAGGGFAGIGVRTEERNDNAGSAGSFAYYSEEFVWSGTNTVQDASFVGSAAADLYSGSLHSVSTVVNWEPISGPLLALGTRTHQSTSYASIGDSFSILPNNASAGGGIATLTLRVHGEFAYSPFIDLNSLDDIGDAYNYFRAYAVLRLMDLGGIALERELFYLNSSNFPDNEAYLAERLRLNQAIREKEIGLSGVEYWSYPTYVDQGVSSNQRFLANAGEVSHNIAISFFVPENGLSLDWRASLGTVVGLDSSVTNAWISADFGNTAELFLDLPTGYTAFSGSGVFPEANISNTDVPFTPVPEPSTYGLMGAIVALGVVAFRRHQGRKRSV